VEHVCTAAAAQGIACATGFCKGGACSPLASAFVWYDGSPGTSTAQEPFSYNSSAGTNTIAVTGLGKYTVTLGRLGAHDGGNVQVSAYGTAAEHCNVDRWVSDGTDLDVDIACYRPDGTPVESLFTLAYVWRSDNIGIEGGYVRVDDPLASTYVAT